MHGTAPVSGDAVNGGGPLGQPEAMEESGMANGAEAIAEAREIARSARQLQAIVEKITAEEFHWQESHYDHDSRHGRELLFLIANHEWVRATSEIIDISRSDAIETTIKIDIDLDQITHAAFRKRTGLFWLPVALLPPQPAGNANPDSDRHCLEPDPFATVRDATGELLPLLPTADVRHQMSAALAEIIVNMAVARWPDANGERPTATRDQRLLLSAAIYRSLRRGNAAGKSAVPGTGAGKSGISASACRIYNAKQELMRLLDRYIVLLEEVVDKFSGKGVDSDSAPDNRQFTPELVRRSVVVRKALADSVVVVVPVNRATTPTVLTMRVPTRSLNSPSVSKLWRPSTWMLRPLGRLEIDVLLPTADADRQVQINLDDGVSFEEAHPAEAKDASLPRMDIRVGRPQPLEDLTVLMGQILDPQQRKRAPSLQQCLADLARSKMGAARETLRQYDVVSAHDLSFPSARAGQTATQRARHTLGRLRTALDQSYTKDGVVTEELEDAWKTFKRETPSFCRRASAERPSPRTVVARAEMIEDVYQRATPERAKIHADIVVTDSEYFSIARFSGRLSLLLMTVVLAFLAISQLTKHGAILSPEVLAIVLTIISAIQAGQMKGPDRSTMCGLLSSAGNWLIAASILPAVILAVALAFSRGGWVPTIWAGICVGLQLLFQLAMLRGPLTPTGSPRGKQRRKFFTTEPNYHPFEALRSDYWRSTTADALMIGRTAYARVIWQKEVTPQLKPVLDWKSGYPLPDDPANVLALLRAGTFGQAVTFVVFRQEPEKDWVKNATIIEPDFHPDRLAPMESITGVVDVFVGVSRDEMLAITDHPVTGILKAAARRLIVLDAQLPVPAPVEGYGGRQWARVRLGLRNNGDIKRLAPFLDNVYKRMTAKSSDKQPYVVAVQMARTVAPRIIAGPKKCRTTESNLVLTSDLDITYPAANQGEDVDARTWRVLTLCSHARSNIESDILSRVADAAEQQPQLAGLTYAVLHGMAVMTLVVHEPQEYPGQEGNLEGNLQRDPSRKLPVLISEKLSRKELAPATAYPLLRVHFRWQDRPGAILNVLDSLSKTLNEEFPSSEADHWSVSYARTQAAAGGAAVARLTLRVHISPGDLASWNPNSEEIERKVRTFVAQELIAGRHASSSGDELDSQEDPVINVDLIRTRSRTTNDSA